MRKKKGDGKKLFPLAFSTLKYLEMMLQTLTRLFIIYCFLCLKKPLQNSKINMYHSSELNLGKHAAIPTLSDLQSRQSNDRQPLVMLHTLIWQLKDISSHLCPNLCTAFIHQHHLPTPPAPPWVLQRDQDFTCKKGPDFEVLPVCNLWTSLASQNMYFSAALLISHEYNPPSHAHVTLLCSERDNLLMLTD